MNFKNVSPKKILEPGVPKTAFRILAEVLPGDAIMPDKGFDIGPELQYNTIQN